MSKLQDLKTKQKLLSDEKLLVEEEVEEEEEEEEGEDGGHEEEDFREMKEKEKVKEKEKEEEGKEEKEKEEKGKEEEGKDNPRQALEEAKEDNLEEKEGSRIKEKHLLGLTRRRLIDQPGMKEVRIEEGEDHLFNEEIREITIRVIHLTIKDNAGQEVSDEKTSSKHPLKRHCL